MPKPLSFADAVDRLESRGIMPDRSPGLATTRAGLQRLAADRFDPKKTIVVAGTNGKGSTCAALDALLRSAGHKVGLYTSPHLECYTERIQVDGAPISRKLFVEAFEQVDEATADLKLSHFETLTLMAMWIFTKRFSLDYIILEVGLGGTWDATNAVPHDICAIAKLGMDHENLLGSSIEEIARTKFGIVHSNALVAHQPFENESVRAIAEKAKTETKSLWIEARACQSVVVFEGRLPRFVVKTPWGEAQTALPGRRGAENTALALTLFEALGFSSTSHLHALKLISWPARMEHVSDDPCPVYLSGDHNPQGVKSLIELLAHYPRKHLHLIVGIGKDKDLGGILTPLFALPRASVFLTETPFRGRTLHEYGDYLSRARFAASSQDAVFAKVRSLASSDDMILITGSLYLAGKMRAQLVRAGKGTV